MPGLLRHGARAGKGPGLVLRGNPFSPAITSRRRPAKRIGHLASCYSKLAAPPGAYSSAISTMARPM